MIVPSKPYRLIGSDMAPQSLRTGGVEFFPRGRDALAAAISRLGRGKPARVLVPALFCSSSLRPLASRGFTVEFMDVEANTGWSSGRLAERLGKGGIDAVLLVHFFGYRQPDRAGCVRVCEEHGVPIVDDCCHALFPSMDIEEYLPGSAALVFSMRKQLPVVGGGLLLSRDQTNTAGALGEPRSGLSFGEIRRRAEQAWCAIGWPNPYAEYIDFLRERLVLSAGGADEPRHACRPHMQLITAMNDRGSLDVVAQRRSENAECLRRHLNAIIETLEVASLLCDTGPLAFPVLDASGTLLRSLRRRGVGAVAWPGDDLPAGVRGESAFPVANALADALVCLPVHQDLSADHLGYIIDATSRWQGRAGGR